MTRGGHSHLGSARGTPRSKTARAFPEQPDLLSWTPPQVEIAFEEGEVRGSTVSARCSRAVAVALRDCGRTRAEVAQRMSEFLGERVSVCMLDAYASVSRELHRISLPRFAALVAVTRDRRLLQMLAEPLGLAVVEKRHLALIRAAEMREAGERLRREGMTLLRRARQAERP